MTGVGVSCNNLGRYSTLMVALQYSPSQLQRMTLWRVYNIHLAFVGHFLKHMPRPCMVHYAYRQSSRWSESEHETISSLTLIYEEDRKVFRPSERLGTGVNNQGQWCRIAYHSGPSPPQVLRDTVRPPPPPPTAPSTWPTSVCVSSQRLSGQRHLCAKPRQ